MASILLRAAQESKVRNPDYNFSVVLCAAELLDERGIRHSGNVRGRVGSVPWILMGKTTDSELDESGVYALRTPVMQKSLKEKMLSIFDPRLHPGCRGSLPDSCNMQFLGLRVLSVDDVPVNQQLMQFFLRRLGVQVDIASNGKEVC